MLHYRDIQVEKGPSSKLRKALPKLVIFLFTGFLAAGFMLVGGCGNNPKSEEQQPIEPASEQSTVLDDYEIIDGDKFFAKPQKPVKSKEHGGPSIETENTEKKAIVNTFSEVLYYGIELDLSEEFLQIIDELHKNEAGELVQYPFYKIAEKNHLDYKEKVIIFAEDAKVTDSERVFWDTTTHSLRFDFEELRQVPGIKIDPTSKENIEDALSEITRKYFDQELSFKVKGIFEEDGLLRVSFARTEQMGNLTVPHFGLFYEPFLLLDDKGYIKEGRISILTLEKDGESPIISREELLKTLNNTSFLKVISISPDPELFSYVYFRTGDERATITLVDFQPVLYIRDIGQPHASLNIISENPGFVEIDGNNYAADFYLRMNALPEGSFERRSPGYNIY